MKRKLIICISCALIGLLIEIIFFCTPKRPPSVSGINDVPSYTKGTIIDISELNSEITVKIKQEDATDFLGNTVLVLECNPNAIDEPRFAELFIGQHIKFYYFDYQIEGNTIKDIEFLV